MICPELLPLYILTQSIQSRDRINKMIKKCKRKLYMLYTIKTRLCKLKKKHLARISYNNFFLLNIKMASVHNTVLGPFVVNINLFGFPNV